MVRVGIGNMQSAIPPPPGIGVRKWPVILILSTLMLNASDNWSKMSSFIALPISSISSVECKGPSRILRCQAGPNGSAAVSYTHLRAHETRHDLVCRLLLEK